MRFDDMLATVLAQPEASAATRAAKWRQLVDLLAQPRRPADPLNRQRALAYLRAHRDQVDTRTRREIALSLQGRRVSPSLLQFFGEDHPAVAAPIVATARLDPEEWLGLLPSMSPTARALLRHRRDLDPEVAKALAAFGASDFVLPGAVGGEALQAETMEIPSPAGEGGDAQIRDLVARIEAFRRERGAGFEHGEDRTAPVAGFRWETGPDGVIVWVEGAPRGPLIGQTIAGVAAQGGFGVDGQAAGAFEKRAPFRDARLKVAGAGGVAGDWRISGVPFFDPRLGSFLGYRGSARRPRIDEIAPAGLNAPGEGGIFGTDLPADALRQLIHELRTPLNAIAGFAELIDGQYMGPAASGYRVRAQEILEHASRLLSAVDDLDTAARIETQRFAPDHSAVDTAELLSRLRTAYERVAEQRSARIDLMLEEELPLARVGQATAERMVARLLAATIGLAGEGETIGAAMTMGEIAGTPMLCLAIDRPRAIADQDEGALLDPGYSPDGDWPGAPALGLGFALRLVRSLAETVGGALIVGETRFFLYLPPVDHAERTSEQSS